MQGIALFRRIIGPSVTRAEAEESQPREYTFRLRLRWGSHLAAWSRVEAKGIATFKQLPSSPSHFSHHLRLRALPQRYLGLFRLCHTLGLVLSSPCQPAELEVRFLSVAKSVIPHLFVF